MGNQISSNRFQSAQKIDDLMLKLSIHGPLQSNVSNKQITVTIDGFLMENDVEVTPSADAVEGFKSFVSTPEFKEYLQSSLLARNVESIEGFSYEIPAKTLDQLSWSIDSTPELGYDNDLFTVSFKLMLKDEKNDEHKLSRAAAFIGKSIVAALKQKRSEVIPPLEPKSFAPTGVTFST